MRARFRLATLEDVPVLASLNAELITAEGHRSKMTVPELEQRMAEWLRSDYRAALFGMETDPAGGYALWRSEADYLYVRQLYVDPRWRRRGLARDALEWLATTAQPETPFLRIDVLVGNIGAIAFWRAVGFRDYALTLERPRGRPTGG